MSRIKPIQVAGLKIIELAKKLRKRKYAKKSKKNVERARGVRTSKSVKAYNIRVKDKETKIIPVKRQSQRGSTFQIHRIRSKMGRAAAQSEEKGKLPSPTPTLDRLFKGDVQRGKLDDYRLTRMYLRNKLSDVAKKKFKGGIMNKRKLKKLVKKKGLPMPLMTKSKFKDAGKFPYVKKLTGGQAKLDKNKNNRIDAEDFKILRAEKAKGRGQGLQDEKMKPGKTMKAMGGGMMKRYTKGGGADTGTLGSLRSTKVKDKFPFANVKRLTKKKQELAKDLQSPRQSTRALALKALQASKKMGGGMMMKRPMMKKGGGADTGKAGERTSQREVARDKRKRVLRGDIEGSIGPYIKKKMGGGMMMAPRGAMGAMGGGMATPMGYKAGKSVKVKCKLGRNKPTKMY